MPGRDDPLFWESRPPVELSGPPEEPAPLKPPSADNRLADAVRTLSDDDALPPLRAAGERARGAAAARDRQAPRADAVQRPRPAEQPQPAAQARVWPSVEKQRARERARQARPGGEGPVRSVPAARERVRRRIERARRGVLAPTRPRRLDTVMPYLGWLLVPLAVVLLAVALWRGGSSGATAPAGASASAGHRPAPTRRAAAPATPVAPATTSGSRNVLVDIRVEDLGRASTSQRVVVVLGDRPLATGSVGLPLHLSAAAAPGDKLTILVPQPTSAVKLLCSVSASGGVTGTMTREQSDGMLDCSTTVADLVSGGS